MLKKYLLIVALMLLKLTVAFTQTDSFRIQRTKFIIDIPVFDIPSNTDHGGLGFKQYCPSMQQSLAWSKSFSEIQQYYTKRLFFKPDKKYKSSGTFFRYLGFFTTDLVMQFFLSNIPLGDGWLHEEWHRAVMNKNNVRSYDDMNKFPVFSPSVNVSHETDEALARFKASNNADFVRMGVAGIEGQYELIKAMQKENFYYKLYQSSQVKYFVNIANSVSYVKFCSIKDDSYTIGAEKQEGTDISKRDFTGLDFIGWIYDLSRPNEAYSARGIHPSGIGIRRYRRAGDLTEEELGYLKKMGKLQMLNYITPHLFFINSIKVNNNFRFNFGMFHYLSSFGYDAGCNFFMDYKTNFVFFALHNYHNLNHSFYGLETQLIDRKVLFRNREYYLTPSLNLWTQPVNQEFRTSKVQPGCRAEIRISTIAGKVWHPYITLSAKTKGWVAGDVYLNSNVSARIGVSAFIH